MTGTTVHIPTLTTERLTLRAPRMSDFEDFAAMVQSSRARYMKERLTRDEAWGWFCSDVAHWSLFGFGALTIEHTGTGTPLGQVGIGRGIRFPETELGWLLYDGHEGRGYATEAARALRAWGYANCGIPTLVSYIDRDNAASIRVAERLGAVPDDDADRPEPEDVVYRHPAREVAA